jgi:hypothetical protein
MKLVLVVLAGIAIFLILWDPIWEKNAKGFTKPFNIISGDTAVIDDLSGFTQFEWDTLYSFEPYTPASKIYEVVGYKWTIIRPTVNENMNQVVFLHNGKVVCYIDGYPSKYKVYFKFSGYEDHYIKLTRSDKLTFRMTIKDNGIREFEYLD